MVTIAASEYVARIVEEAPPLDDAQRVVILAALDGHVPSSAPSRTAA